MPKFNLNDLEGYMRFSVIASLKVAIYLEKDGFSKEEYMTWCSEIWETMKLSAPDELENILNCAMEDDMKRILRGYQEGSQYNGHCC